MVTLLQLINHVQNGFDVSTMEISKTSLAPDDHKKFEVLLEEDHNETQEALGRVSTSHLYCEKNYQNTSKDMKKLLFFVRRLSLMSQ